MKVWLLSVALLFGVVELYQWMQDVTLPLPIYAIAGVLLAIASNYQKGLNEVFERPTRAVDGELIASPPPPPSQQTQILPSQGSISFTIQKQKQTGTEV
jgi:hypothetical protein